VWEQRGNLRLEVRGVGHWQAPRAVAALTGQSGQTSQSVGNHDEK
jgi:hypothetical protein